MSVRGQSWQCVAGKQDRTLHPHVLLLTQAPALSEKYPRAIRGGGGVRQLHEYCALAAHTLGQLKLYHSAGTGQFISPFALGKLQDLAEQPRGFLGSGLWMSGQRNMDSIVIINEDTEPGLCWYFVPSHPQPQTSPWGSETLGLGSDIHSGFMVVIRPGQPGLVQTTQLSLL